MISLEVDRSLDLDTTAEDCFAVFQMEKKFDYSWDSNPWHEAKWITRFTSW